MISPRCSRHRRNLRNAAKRRASRCVLDEQLVQRIRSSLVHSPRRLCHETLELDVVLVADTSLSVRVHDTDRRASTRVAPAGARSLRARNVCSCATTAAPSPMAAPTRFTEPQRTSPTAKIPSIPVSNGSSDRSLSRPAQLLHLLLTARFYVVESEHTLPASASRDIDFQLRNAARLKFTLGYALTKLSVGRRRFARSLLAVECKNWIWTPPAQHLEEPANR